MAGVLAAAAPWVLAGLGTAGIVGTMLGATARLDKKQVGHVPRLKSTSPRRLIVPAAPRITSPTPPTHSTDLLQAAQYKTDVLYKDTYEKYAAATPMLCPRPPAALVGAKARSWCWGEVHGAVVCICTLEKQLSATTRLIRSAPSFTCGCFFLSGFRSAFLILAMWGYAYFKAQS